MFIDPLSENYQNRRVFLTGHTGFKGSWLTEWLSLLGADVFGYAKPASTEPNHFSLLNPRLQKEFLCDVRDADALRHAVDQSEPEIVFHLAAQSLVRQSYRDPLETFETNVVGTANLLEACRRCPTIKAIIVITSDKCYQNAEKEQGYRESDRLGGHDPYSASKACAELVVDSFRKSFPDLPPVATCRAGNVIGGGDWATDRLIPDLVRAASQGIASEIRMPLATRPWQHVLEPLGGYLLLGQKLLDGQHDFAGAWNFGPDSESNLSVGKIVEKSSDCWDQIKFVVKPDSSFHEAQVLMLDCEKTKQRLQWKPRWNIDKTVAQTIRWYKEFYETKKLLTKEQIELYGRSGFVASDIDGPVYCT